MYNSACHLSQASSIGFYISMSATVSLMTCSKSIQFPSVGVSAPSALHLEYIPSVGSVALASGKYNFGNAIKSLFTLKSINTQVKSRRDERSADIQQG